MVETQNARLHFTAEAGPFGRVPALVVHGREWTDPAPRDLVHENRNALQQIASVVSFKAYVTALLERERAYLAADDVEQPPNERYAIQNLRRQALFEALAVNTTAIPATAFRSAKGFLQMAQEQLVLGRAYVMDVGSHLDDWPIGDEYLSPLIDLLDQTPPESPGRDAIQARIDDIRARKPVFTDASNIDTAIAVDPYPTSVECWGHAHNEATANALGIAPDKSTTIYVAGAPPEHALKRYTPDRAWDALGALAADHEAGYVRLATGAPTTVGRTEVAGRLDDGGHWVQLTLDDGSALRFLAHVTRIGHRYETGRHRDPLRRFRRYVETNDGTFEPNPVLRHAATDKADIADVDCTSHELSFHTEHPHLDESGQVVHIRRDITLSPNHRVSVHLGDDLRRASDGMVEIVEHHYTPSEKTYRRAVYSAQIHDGQVVRRLIHDGAPRPVRSVVARQQTPSDSVIALHDFFTRAPGRPFVIDTSFGRPEMHHAVDFMRLDRSRLVERTEGGRHYTYTTYRLRYQTHGGPEGVARYIIKRDDEGNAVAATALDPMPAFAYRHQQWVMAPLATDASGTVAVNAQALEAGYLVDRVGRFEPSVWAGLGRILYGALSKDTRSEGALLFVDRDGRTLSFRRHEDFDRAVEADRRAQHGGDAE